MIWQVNALSIRQPWAWLIVHGPKRYENRDWSERNPCRRFRGPVLIHAAKGMTRDEYEMARTIAWEQMVALPDFHELRRGGIIGMAEVVAWHDTPPRGNVWAFGSGLELANVQSLPFQECKGALGFFKVLIQQPRNKAAKKGGGR